MIWMIDGIIYHTYYEKLMKTPFTVMQRSAMSEHQKMSILSNELVRRLSNIHKDVVAVEIEAVIEQYTGQLKASGYSRKQTKEIVVYGVVGWRRKLERREKAGQGQYLAAEDTLKSRTEAKLLEKTTWFKGNQKRKLENKESNYQYHPPSKRRKRKQQEQAKEGKGESKKVKSVMFVPYTAHSELATRLRDSEKTMQQMTGYRLKIVEKVGYKLVDMLTKANP